ncbi:MAG TPA: hypothetical protein VGG71_02470 [Chitinophagaceae bacterium]
MNRKANPKTKATKHKIGTTEQKTNADGEKTNTNEVNKKFPLPIYNEEDDIYEREKEQPLGDPEKIGIRTGTGKQKSMDLGLDVPGSELDDADEFVGEEDEENNYYSLGGDRHEDLEEEKE